MRAALERWSSARGRPIAGVSGAAAPITAIGAQLHGISSVRRGPEQMARAERRGFSHIGVAMDMASVIDKLHFSFFPLF